MRELVAGSVVNVTLSIDYIRSGLKTFQQKHWNWGENGIIYKYPMVKAVAWLVVIGSAGVGGW
jgi:hypothetical protein